MRKLLEIPSVRDMWGTVNDKFMYCLPNGPIYHYTATIGAVKNILSEGELWVSKSTVMNDFSEISYGFNLLIEILRQEADKDDYLRPIIDSAIEFWGKGYGDVYILSFSENGKSRLLWDSYSKKDGYCLGFKESFVEDFIQRKPQCDKPICGELKKPVSQASK